MTDFSVVHSYTNIEGLPDSIIQIINKKIVFVTGKGGVGKTTATAMLATKALQIGKRVAIVEFQSLGEFQKLLDTKLYEQSKLRILELNPSENIQKYFEYYVSDSFVNRVALSNSVIRSFIKSVPGIAEISFLGRLIHMAQTNKEVDIFLVDGFASGHFYSLIKTPYMIRSLIHQGKLIHQIDEICNFMRDDNQCVGLYVTNPEQVVYEETRDFLGQLAELNQLKFSYLLLNRYYDSCDLQLIPEYTRKYLKAKQDESHKFLQLCIDMAGSINIIGLQENYSHDLNMLFYDLKHRLGEQI